MLIKCILMTAIAFFSGSLMFSYYIPKKLKNVDVRKIPGGDGNPGSSNAIRAAGVPIGAVCMFLDIIKATVPVLAAQYLVMLDGFYMVSVLIAPVFGHAFSPFLKFKGGKAISACFGILIALLPISRLGLAVAISMFVFKFIIAVKPDSASVFVSLCVSIIFAIIFEPFLYIKLAFVILSIAIMYHMVRYPDKGDVSVSILKWNVNLGDLIHKT